MPRPRKHHYIPAFYLKQWEGADRKLYECRRKPDGKYLSHRQRSKVTGLEGDLYRADGLAEPDDQAIERDFLSPLDDKASKVLEVMLGGNSAAFPPDWRSAWTRFILSLKFRTPEAVRLIRHHLQDLWEKGIPKFEANYPKWRLPTDPESSADYLSGVDSALPHKAPWHFFQAIIDNDFLGPKIHDMKWNCLHLKDVRFTLLTSDRPLIMPEGLYSKHAQITFPLGPSTLFVADHDERWAEKYEHHPTGAVEFVNRQVVEGARNVVWSVDDRQQRFISNRMSRRPEKPLLTDAQKKRAIDKAFTQPQRV